MKCKHKDVRQQYSRDTVRDWNVVTHWCGTCDTQLPLGESNDAIPAAEMQLAEILAEIPQLWEPRDQERVISAQVAYCADTDSMHIFRHCSGTTRVAPTNVQCMRCGWYGQQCDRTHTTHGADE